MASKKNKKGKPETKPDYDPYTEVKAKGEHFTTSALVFRYNLDRENHELRDSIFNKIKQHNMGPYYEHLAKRFNWKVDEGLVATFEKTNTKKVAELQQALVVANKEAGDGEQFDAAVNIAEHYIAIGDKAKSLEAFDAALKKAFSSGQKIDIALAKARCGLFFADMTVVKESLEKAAGFMESGGDWDRRNRLQVYQGTEAILNRDFEKASGLFLSSLATFTCFELHSFEHFVFLTIVVSVLSLKRPELKAQVIESPEILSVVEHIPHIGTFLKALHDCNYKSFMASIVDLHETFMHNQFLSAHVDYFLRECRVLAYKQFLQSYKSVTLASMAAAFGYSENFLDVELARFIAVDRLSARIDKVSGIVETCRPDTKNAQYKDVLEKGDKLLNSIQKLSRAISL